MSEDLPKQDLLRKLLKMTTSANDGEALTAVRKANELLQTAGWDWDKFIDGKIKVVADPFASMENPFTRPSFDRPAPPAPARPTAPPAPQPRRPAPPPFYPPPFNPPPPPPKPQPVVALSSKGNIYAGWCYCCGDAVGIQDGLIFDPSIHNPQARSKWQITCKRCNTSRHRVIGKSAAPRQRPLGNINPPSLGDI